MSFFTDAEALWIKAGGPPDVAPIAAAIAATESTDGKNVYGDAAYSGNGQPSSFGIWQIHTFNQDGYVHVMPDGQPYDNQRLATDPLYCAQAAVNVYKEAGDHFKPWSTYNTEAYYDNLAAGTGHTVAQVKAGDFAPAGPSNGPTPPSATAPAPAPSPEPPRSPATASTVLREGSRGAAVADVQAQLGVAIDGVYGPKTEAAVRGYQSTHGLEADGIVGPQTQASFGRESQNVLREGSTGAAVVGVQEQVGATPDGVYGPETKAAVERFQRSHHLTADGVVGQNTRAALTQERHARFETPSAAPHPTAPAHPAPPVAHPSPPSPGPAAPSPGPAGWTPAPAPAGTHKFIAPTLQAFESTYRADPTHANLSMRYDETSETLTASYTNSHHDTFVSTVRTSDPKASYDTISGHGSITLAPGQYIIANGRHQTPTQGEGPAFTQVLNANGTDGLRDVNGEVHTQIGLHGGGSGLANPQAPLQPLTGTNGCIRLHNVDAATVASLSIEAGHIPFEIQGRAPRGVEVQDAATRLRSEGGPSLPAVTKIVPWDGKPHTGTIVVVDQNTVAQHVGRGEYIVYDVNHDLKGKTPAEGTSVTIDARGDVTAPHLQQSHQQPALSHR